MGILNKACSINFIFQPCYRVHFCAVQCLRSNKICNEDDEFITLKYYRNFILFILANLMSIFEMHIAYIYIDTNFLPIVLFRGHMKNEYALFIKALEVC